ncbi:hypothetical protein CC78DRAFT_137138 [Lojkania enalia]|uniref:Uncharacterized protein n=1 Tax=Lojkania enalia TaxID=147567 RepID=A0A9P4TRR4_9PLEO|nr:hypothetical protein CC78DRAFT_137138 [Didymosphaeria enalia]
MIADMGPGRFGNEHIRSKVQGTNGTRPIPTLQSCNRLVSSLVGDYKRIPAVVCFAKNFSSQIKHFTLYYGYADAPSGWVALSNPELCECWRSRRT